MRLSNLLQFIIGFILGITLLALGAAGASYLMVARMTSKPPKPVFTEEEKKAVTTPVKSSPSPTPSPEKEKTKPNPQPSPEKEEKKEDLPPGAYKARVTWSDGLSLRAEPSAGASRVGGVAYNQELIILGSSSDGQWQKVRIASSGQEAWVKAGNVAKSE
jgi:hypothetical protein